MGSLEILFERIEKSGNSSYSEILDWLSGDRDKNRNSYKNVAAILAEPFQIEARIGQAETINDLDDLLIEADSIGPSNARKKAKGEVQAKINEFEKEIEIAISQEEKIAEDIAEAEERKIEASDLTTNEKRERLNATEETRREQIRILRQTNLKSLRGFQRGELNRGLAALAKIT